MALEISHLLTQDRQLRQLARYLTGDGHNADEITQDAWVAALSSSQPIHDGGAWLRGVVRRLTWNQRRRERLRGEHEARASREESIDGRTGQAVEAAELREAVVGAVTRLPGRYRDVIEACFFQERTPLQIAESWGVPAQTVRTQLRRAKALLETQLDREYGRRSSWCVPLAAIAGHALNPAGGAATGIASSGVHAATTSTTLSSTLTKSVVLLTTVLAVAIPSYWIGDHHGRNSASMSAESLQPPASGDGSGSVVADRTREEELAGEFRRTRERLRELEARSAGNASVATPSANESSPSPASDASEDSKAVVASREIERIQREFNEGIRPPFIAYDDLPRTMKDAGASPAGLFYERKSGVIASLSLTVRGRPLLVFPEERWRAEEILLDYERQLAIKEQFFARCERTGTCLEISKADVKRRIAELREAGERMVGRRLEDGSIRIAVLDANARQQLEDLGAHIDERRAELGATRTVFQSGSRTLSELE